MLTYSKGQGKEENWLIGEERFSMEHQGKCESIFSLSNGYLGIRSAFEEAYPYQTRGMFAAGCYSSLAGETTELANAADSCEVKLYFGGELFSMVQGNVLSYERYLNLYTGELVRNVLWESPEHKKYQVCFRRCVSMKDVHVYALRLEIRPLENDAEIIAETGINARMANSGVQHFEDGTKRVLEENLMYLEQAMHSGNITLYHCCGTKADSGGYVKQSHGMQRRQISEQSVFRVKKGETGGWEKICVLYTSRDFSAVEEEYIQKMVVLSTEKAREKGYGRILEDSRKVWEEHWKRFDVKVKAEDERLQLAVRFAQFHLMSMMPADSRNSIAAKGLTGEGYKGHIFWDTEVFMLPYFLYTYPEKARQLLEYRVRKAEQAGQNAAQKGYKGFMFPWESCETGREETPLFVSMDIITGRAAHVWAGLKEHHVTADIAYAVWMYYNSTDDRVFMEKEGIKLLVGCALFWISRSRYVKEKERYEICDIIGPDEYTEHIDNNAYTNYLAHFVTGRALEILNTCTEEKKKSIDAYFEEEDVKEKLEEYYRKLYLPKADANHVIPQDDTFMGKKIIDVSEYRNDNIKQMILKSFSREEVNDMQVLKQADTVMLLEMLPDLFGMEEKKATWEYYEPKTIHDSSLSRAVYSIVASDNHEPEKAYENYLEAVNIDMGQNPHSSDEGIHAASMGGIWLAMVRGFLGIQMKDGELHINPCLPETIQEICCTVVVQGQEVRVRAARENVWAECTERLRIPVVICGKRQNPAILT